MQSFQIKSQLDGITLYGTLLEPSAAPRAIVQITHGMSEHKERYYDFMEYLAGHGYVVAIHDHRGHGESLVAEGEYGYFHEQPYDALTQDLLQVSAYLKDRYPGLPLYLMGHSMGTLVSRLLLKEHDDAIDKLILSGPPTYNPLSGVAMTISALMARLYGAGARVDLLHQLVFGAYNKGFTTENAWLSVNEDNVTAYHADPLCGFVFTVDGFRALFYMLHEAFTQKGWGMRHTKLPILLLAGAQDPVIQSKKSFLELKSFLMERGYTHVVSRLYDNMRHEILNETDKLLVYEDILRFLEE